MLLCLLSAALCFNQPRCCVLVSQQCGSSSTPPQAALVAFSNIVLFPGVVVSKSALLPATPHPQVVNSSWALKRLQPLPLEDVRRGSFQSQLPAGSSQVRRCAGLVALHEPWQAPVEG